MMIMSISLVLYFRTSFVLMIIVIVVVYKISINEEAWFLMMRVMGLVLGLVSLWGVILIGAD